MNNTKIFITRIATITGFALGAFALSAMAAGSWKQAPPMPPNENAETPINVGPSKQFKNGQIGIRATSDTTSDLPNVATLFDVFGIGVINDLFSNKLTTNSLAVLGGALAEGNVLTSDATGNATWRPARGGGGGGGSIVITKYEPFKAFVDGRSEFKDKPVYLGKHDYCAFSGLRTNFKTNEDTYVEVDRVTASTDKGFNLSDINNRNLQVLGFLPLGSWYIMTSHATQDLAVTCFDLK